MAPRVQRPKWETEPYRRELTTQVVGCGDGPGSAWAVLADTIFYPEGGGQPCDRGWINDTPVLAVRRTAWGVVHELAEKIPLGPAYLRLDWPRRYDHMQQHTAQHLLTALAQDRCGWPTTAFHLGERVCDVELAVPSIDEEGLLELEEAVAAEIRACRPVRRLWVRLEELVNLPVRTRGLPSGHRSEVRLIEIDGIDLNTCGGTHLTCTSEIESIVLLGTEPMRGGTRVFFAAGGRLRRIVRDQAEVLAELRTLLGAPTEDLAATTRAKLEALRSSERLVRRLQDELADALGEALAATGDPVVYRHLPNKDLTFLQRAARRFLAQAPAGVIVLTADASTDAVFCLASGERANVDAAELAAVFCAVVGGRSGGSGRFFQGRIHSFAQVKAAVEAVQRACKAPCTG